MFLLRKLTYDKNGNCAGKVLQYRKSAQVVPFLLSLVRGTPFSATGQKFAKAQDKLPDSFLWCAQKMNFFSTDSFFIVSLKLQMFLLQRSGRKCLNPPNEVYFCLQVEYFRSQIKSYVKTFKNSVQGNFFVSLFSLKKFEVQLHLKIRSPFHLQFAVNFVEYQTRLSLEPNTFADKVFPRTIF